jgi:hypothetical protein
MISRIMFKDIHNIMYQHQSVRKHLLLSDLKQSNIGLKTFSEPSKCNLYKPVSFIMQIRISNSIQVDTGDFDQSLKKNRDERKTNLLPDMFFSTLLYQGRSVFTRLKGIVIAGLVEKEKVNVKVMKNKS